MIGLTCNQLFKAEVGNSGALSKPPAALVQQAVMYEEFLILVQRFVSGYQVLIDFTIVMCGRDVCYKESCTRKHDCNIL